MGNLAVKASVRSPAPDPAAGCEDGLVRAFNDVRAELVSTLFFLLGNHEDAQDAAQEAFLKCWRARPGLPAVQNLRAWIFRVGLNAAKDLRRSAWRRRSRPLAAVQFTPAGSGVSAAEALEQQESQERLRAALLNLRQEEKEVFLLRQNGDLTYEEISDLRGSPVGTVKTQMRSALHKLRRVLQEI
jgi:RNA polymerase sigma-70 factor (ECF subfamily)